MNAAMHGISRREALDRIPEIIEFAELDDFADNPLRQYSSGMYLRLAFSVAINMQPDILLADEILAVGDIAFQERCLQRVAQEAERGLTVLFVSHDMAAVVAALPPHHLDRQGRGDAGRRAGARRRRVRGCGAARATAARPPSARRPDAIPTSSPRSPRSAC